jgi:hypothetical protein
LIYLENPLCSQPASKQASSALDGLLSATRAIATVLLLLLLFVVASYRVFVLFWEFFWGLCRL